MPLPQIPRLQTLWCGCSVQLGAKVVGYLHLAGLFGGLFSALVIETGHKVKGDWMQESSTPDPTHFYRSSVFFRESMLMMAVFTILLTSAALLYGIRRGQTDFMEPFLIAKGTSLFVDLFNFLLSIIARVMRHKDIYIFYQLLFLGVEGLMFLIVHSHYRDVVERITGPSSETT